MVAFRDSLALETTELRDMFESTERGCMDDRLGGLGQLILLMI